MNRRTEDKGQKAKDKKMTFTVTYRGSDGAMREETVEAADRAECVAACKARGIAPTSIREGRAASPKRTTQGGAGRAANVSAASRGGIWKAAILASVALAVAVGLWWWFASARDGQADARERVPPARGVVSGKRPKPVEPKRIEAVPITPTAAVHVAEAPKAAPTGKVIKARSARSGRVMTLPDGTVVTNAPRVFFKRDFERALHVALMPNGMGGTLLRQVRSRYTDEQILAMLKERGPPEPGDDATTVAVKEKVQNFKDEMLRVINQGASVSDVLDGMTRRKEADGLLRAKAFKIRTEALRSEDPEKARQSIQSANAVLDENGLRKMEIPHRLTESNAPADGGAEEKAAGGKVSEDQTKGEKQ